MSALCPTPPLLLVDAQDRPCFLWDLDLTIGAFRERLDAPDPAVRAYFIAKLMRQAKPDDVFSFVSLADIRRLWPKIVGHLGETRAFWTWLLDMWKDRGADPEPIPDPVNRPPAAATAGGRAPRSA